MRLAIAVLAAGVGLCGCGDRSATATFALVPKAMNNPFFDRARDGCKQAEAELDGVECLYIGPGEHSEQEQVQIVVDLITRGVDGIAVSPSNAPAIARALERARAAGIPTLTWDSDLLEEDRQWRAAYIGTRNYEIGARQAEIARRLKPRGGTLCIQSGGPAAANHNERMQGIRDALSGRDSPEPPGRRLEGARGWIEVDGCPVYSNDDLPLAVNQLEDVLARYPDLDAFIVTGGFPQFVAGAYRQVAERYRERIRSGATILVAADTLPMQMEILRDGLSHGQVGQRPFEMGYRAMYALLDLAQGRSVPDPLHTGIDVCLPENVDRCLSVD